MYNNSLLSDQSLNKRELDQELYNYITTNNDLPFSKLIWIYNVKSDNWWKRVAKKSFDTD